MTRRVVTRMAAVLGGVVLLYAVAVWAQTINPTTLIYEFANGLKLCDECTTVTGSTSAGDAAVVLPAQSVGAGEMVGPIHHVILCGDLPNAATNYTSPVSGFASGAIYSDGLTATDLSYALAGTGCAAEDNATEATADEVMFANNAFRVIGFFCAVTSSGSNGVVVTLRSGAANLSPNTTMTIPTATTTKAATITAAPTVAAGATFAASAVTTEDLSAQDFWCMATIMITP